jgi:hypothetical protein
VNKIIRRIPVLDLNQSAFQKYHDNNPEIEMQGTRGVFLFNADNEFFDLSARYNQNEDVPVLDLVNYQRQLKAQLMALKGRGTGDD